MNFYYYNDNASFTPGGKCFVTYCHERLYFSSVFRFKFDGLDRAFFTNVILLEHFCRHKKIKHSFLTDLEVIAICIILLLATSCITIIFLNTTCANDLNIFL